MRISRIASYFAISLGLGVPGLANANTIVDGWTLDLDAAGLVGFGSISDITQVNLTGLFNAVASGDPTTIGTPGSTSGLLSATAFTGSSGLIPVTDTGKVLNYHFEVTFTYQLDSIVTGFDGGDITSTDHTGGTVSVYVDDFSSGVKSNPNFTGTGGAGFDDGILIATFNYVDMPGNGAIFSTASLNGSDDGSFALVQAIEGVLTDSQGASLVNGDSLLGISDTNFDADPDSNGLVDTMVANTIFGENQCSSVGNFCGTQDGSFILAYAPNPIPVPAAAWLMGSGLLGLIGAARRRA